MKDLAIRLENRPGALAEMGETLGIANVSVEGGGSTIFVPAFQSCIFQTAINSIL
jgi:hypothetical protein